MQFQNTKSDIGNCPKRFHEEHLRDKFLEEGERYREEYEREFMQLLEKLVSDLERKLRRGKDRLDIKPSDPTAALNPANDDFEEKRTILVLQIKELLAKIETCGEEGRVQEAQDLMTEVEKYKAELERLRQLEAENPSYRLEKRMEVCQTCGAFLIIGDAQKRIEAHFEGRQHNGWARIREALAELKAKYAHGGGQRRAAMLPPSPQREPGEIGDDLSFNGDRYYPDEASDARRRSHDRGPADGHRRDRDYGRRDRYDRERERDGRGSRGGAGGGGGYYRRDSRSPRRR